MMILIVGTRSYCYLPLGAVLTCSKSVKVGMHIGVLKDEFEVFMKQE